ncbi:MAG: 3',5'-cyclic nucleotide phosphodiesterase [SAR324 cluster bacterium]|nr:3',5'-cyclic nucleotide phosphodiesterase [SAR324 cluster bacterium]
MKFERTYSVLPMRSRRELSALAEKIFVEQGSMKRLGVRPDPLSRFIKEIGDRYRDNPYHNFQHAVDTLYTMAWLLNLPIFKKNLPDFHKYLLLMTALVHDVEHPGHDNQWEIKTHSPLAKKYNNMSVIENHSLAVSKELLEDPELDVFASIEEYKRQDILKLFDQLILCTDFSWHKVFLDELTEGTSRNKFDFKEKEFLSLMCRTLIKAADISNTSKPFRQAKVWGQRVMNEFWAQGEMEKKFNLPVGPLNDSSKSEFNSAQAGFIKFAAYELFALLSRVEEKSEEMVRALQQNQIIYERNAERAAASLK